MKGELTLKILETISDTAENTVDGIHAILRAGYGASMRKMDYEFEKIQKEKRAAIRQRTEDAETKQRAHDFIYSLKRDDLIKIDKKNKQNILQITAKGIFKLKWLRARKDSLLQSKKYDKPKGRGFVLTAFDIPEKYRQKRYWLRSCLKNLGFKMLQKSVWLGKGELPREFIEDLKEYKLFQFIEILVITKTGTIKQVG